eukprot:jgi/Ulvmu1/5151/UM021_0168.1
MSSDREVAEPAAEASEMQLTVHSSSGTGAIAPFVDPREVPLEERLAQAKDHEAKLKHIMESIPIKIRHLQGSSAGAGSGEFHIYRNARNQEQKRLREMEARWKEEQHKLTEKRKHEDAQRALENKTAKNCAKRRKRKGRNQRKEGEVSDVQELPVDPSRVENVDLD